MNLAVAVGFASIVGAPLAAVSLLMMIRTFIRESRADRERREDARLKEKTDPIKEALAAMTADRNYIRDRNSALEDRISALEAMLYGREK